MGKDDKPIYTSNVDRLYRTGMSGAVANILGVKKGDRVQFVLTPEGRVVVEKASK